MNYFKYRKVITVVYVLALFMDYISLTMVSFALPSISKFFHVTANSIELVSTFYIVGMAVIMPASSWFEKVIGARNAFILGLLVIGIGTLSSSFATTSMSLILFCTVIGLGSGLIIPVGMTMFYKSYPKEEHAKAAATALMPAVIAPSLSPVIGGYLINYFSWRAVFLFNIPFVLAAILVTIFYIPSQKNTVKKPLDILGFIFSAGFLFLLIYGTSCIGKNDVSIDKIIFLLGLSALFFIAFILNEFKSLHPLLDLNIFKKKTFVLACVIQLFAFGTTFCTYYFIPIFVQEGLNISPEKAGWFVFPMAVGAIFSSKLASFLTKKFGNKIVIILGSSFYAISMLMFTQVNFSFGLFIIPIACLFRGIAGSLNLIPIQKATFNDLEDSEYSNASSIYACVRQASGSITIAITAMVFNLFEMRYKIFDAHAVVHSLVPYHITFVFIALWVLVGAVFALFLKEDSRLKNKNLVQHETP